MTKHEALDLAWKAEQEANPYTAYNSWCRGYEAGLRQALLESEMPIDQHRGALETKVEYIYDRK